MSTTLRQRQAQFIESHANELKDVLPKPSERWQHRDLEKDFPWSLSSLEQYNIIEDKGTENGATVWKTRRNSYKRINSCVETTDYPLPCHSGIRNMGGERPYTCSNDNCNKRYSRDDVNWSAL